MSYKEIKSLFEDPEYPRGKELKLWRYMDFTKFLSFLNKKALFFPSANTLREIDPWEGKWAEKSEESIEKGYKQYVKPQFQRTADSIINRIRMGTESILDSIFISCWNYNYTESNAMWKLYVGNKYGICIKSNFQNFKYSFNDSNIDVYCGKILYVDYENDDFWNNPKLIPVVNLFIPFLHKRGFLKYEDEYRAIVSIQKEKFTEHDIIDKGVFIPVSLDILIEEIIVAPESPKWFFELVCDTVLKYGLNKNVKYSIIDKKPYQD